MTALNLERTRTAPATEKSDERRTEDDDWERDGEKEDADESRRRQGDHHVILERALPDSHNGFQYNCEYCGLETEKQRNNDGHIAVAGIHVAQRHDGDDARHDEQAAGYDAAERSVHQPADIRCELLRLWSRQQHAVIEGMQESRFRDPAFFLDQDAMHHRDLPRGTAKT